MKARAEYMQCVGVLLYLYVQAIGVIPERVQQGGGQRQQLAGQQRVGAIAHGIAFAVARLVLLRTHHTRKLYTRTHSTQSN